MAALHHSQRKNCHAARLTHVTATLVQWEWLYHPAKTVTQCRDLLQTQRPVPITDGQRPFLGVDTTYTLRDLDVLIATGALPEDPTVLTFSQIELDRVSRVAGSHGSRVVKNVRPRRGRWSQQNCRGRTGSHVERKKTCILFGRESNRRCDDDNG